MTRLTKQETRVANLLAKGQSDKQIAHTLHISVRTANFHMANILQKTQCYNRTAAVIKLMAAGLINP